MSEYTSRVSRATAPVLGSADHTETEIDTWVRRQYVFEMSSRYDQDEGQVQLVRDQIAGMTSSDWTQMFVSLDDTIKINPEEIILTMQAYPEQAYHLCVGLLRPEIYHRMDEFGVRHMSAIIGILRDEHAKEIHKQFSMLLSKRGVENHLYDSSDLLAYLKFGQFNEKRRKTLLERLSSQQKIHELIHNEVDVFNLIDKVPIPVEMIVNEMRYKFNSSVSMNSKIRLMEKFRIIFLANESFKPMIWKSMKSSLSDLKDRRLGQAVLETFSGYEKVIGLLLLGSKSASKKSPNKAKRSYFHLVFDSFYTLEPWLQYFGQDGEIMDYVFSSSGRQRYIGNRVFMNTILDCLHINNVGDVLTNRRIKSLIRSHAENVDDLNKFVTLTSSNLLRMIKLFSDEERDNVICRVMSSFNDFKQILACQGYLNGVKEKNEFRNRIIMNCLKTSVVIQKLDLDQLNQVMGVLNAEERSCLKILYLIKGYLNLNYLQVN